MRKELSKSRERPASVPSDQSHYWDGRIMHLRSSPWYALNWKYHDKNITMRRLIWVFTYHTHTVTSLLLSLCRKTVMSIHVLFEVMIHFFLIDFCNDQRLLSARELSLCSLMRASLTIWIRPTQPSSGLNADAVLEYRLIWIFAIIAWLSYPERQRAR